VSLGLHSITKQPSEAIRIAMEVQVNPSFERLFGYSQLEMRQQFIRLGHKAIYGLIRHEEWPTLLRLDHIAKWCMLSEYQMSAVCISKWNNRVLCWLHCSLLFSDRGDLREYRMRFIPLPLNTQLATGRDEHGHWQQITIRNGGDG
jgi:hypothetical protein